MELFSLQYLLIICILLVIYYLLPLLSERVRRFSLRASTGGHDSPAGEAGGGSCRRKSRQWVILLAASIGFYAYLSGKALVLMLVTSFSVWSGGLLLSKLDADYQVYRKDKTHSREERKAYKASVTRKKRIILVLDLLLNFGILALLKYFVTGILLPLGISFYTFQAVSYLIDQYNGKYPAERNPFKFLLFVSWFPQLLQGPIGRFDKLADQLTQERRFDAAQTIRFRQGLLLILYGLMKKYAIADMLVTSIADILDGGSIADLPGSLIVFAILLYSAQQYTDFSGGIDIVRGVSLLFGIALAQNFRQPYFSTSLGDFWRRWHISLGAWMRDYLFYPLALLKPMQQFGKWCTKHFGRNGKHLGRVLPAGIANIVVFLVVGIWHGPEMHYVLWGLYNGIVIALSDLTEPFWKGLGRRLHFREDAAGLHIFRILRTFLIVNIGWYFDRIYKAGDAITAFGRTFLHFNLRGLPDAIMSQVVAKSTVFNIAGGWFLAFTGLIIVFLVSITDEKPKNGTGPADSKILTPASRMFLHTRFFMRAIFAVVMITMIFASFLFTETAGGFLYANF